MDFAYRPMIQSDLDEVYQIELESEHDTWDYNAFVSSLEMDEAFVLYQVSNKEICGFLFAYQTQDEYSICNIAIKKKHQNKGLAYFFLKTIMDKKEEISNFFLEVRKSNIPALKLYNKLGFKPVYVRKNYYQNPPEDAIVMALSREKEDKHAKI